jgi:hypothetical protein
MHPLAFGDLLQAVQWQVIQVFADNHPGQQSRGGHTAIDDGGWNRRRTDRFAGTAGILRTDVAMDEEAGRLDIELFADVFTDLDEILAALTTGARFRFMAVFDARQMLGEWLTTGTHAFHRLAGLSCSTSASWALVSVFQLSSNSSRCSAENCSLLLAKRIRL